MADIEAACLQDTSNSLISSMNATFKSRFDRTDLLLEVPTRYLLVGTCDSMLAGMARFHREEVVYSFNHPLHRQVEMHMKYADMAAVRIDLCGLKRSSSHPPAPELRFRILNQLVYFSREYDADNEAHELKIGLCSESDMRRLQDLVMPHIRARSSL